MNILGLISQLIGIKTLRLTVDNMLIATKSMCEVNRLKILFHREFEMKDLGVAKKILGMEIRRDRGKKAEIVLEKLHQENA